MVTIPMKQAASDFVVFMSMDGVGSLHWSELEKRSRAQGRETWEPNIEPGDQGLEAREAGLLATAGCWPLAGCWVWTFWGRPG